MLVSIELATGCCCALVAVPESKLRDTSTDFCPEGFYVAARLDRPRSRGGGAVLFVALGLVSGALGDLADGEELCGVALHCSQGGRWHVLLGYRAPHRSATTYYDAVRRAHDAAETCGAEMLYLADGNSPSFDGARQQGTTFERTPRIGSTRRGNDSAFSFMLEAAGMIVVSGSRRDCGSREIDCLTHMRVVMGEV